MPHKQTTTKIYIKDWLRYHPYDRPGRSDLYYLKLCNKVNEVFLGYRYVIWDDVYDDEAYKEMSCILVTWFEDVVSDLGIWKAVVDKHHELYGRYLPFYDLSEYYYNEPNPEDIRFLLWYLFSVRYYQEKIISPLSPFIQSMAYDIYDIFDGHWDEAPVNENMVDFLHIPPQETDFYKVRYKMDWLVLNSYLFTQYDDELTAETIALLEKGKEKEYDMQLLEAMSKGLHDDFVFNMVTSLLAVKGNEWLARILGNDHPLYKPLLQINNKKTGSFLFEGEDPYNLLFRHIASGTRIEVTKKSLDKLGLTPSESMVILGLVNWMGEWWFSGSLAVNDMNDDILLKETSDPVAANLFTPVEEKAQYVNQQEEIFLEFNRHNPIAFCQNDQELMGFMNKFMKEYNKKVSLKSDKKNMADRDYTQNMAPDLGNSEWAEVPKMIFFNPGIGIEVVTGLNHIVPDKDNADYNPDHTREETMLLMQDDTISKDFTQYLLSNYEINFLGFPGDDGEKAFRDNLGFMLRFLKPRHYYTEPQMTLLE